MAAKQILVIDDDASLQRVIEFTLQEAGYVVTTADSGQEGVQAFARTSPPVVITDIKLPDLSGLEVLRHIKEQRPETLVIVITAFGTVEMAVEAMKLGAYDYITKPFSRDELRLVLDKAFTLQGLREENDQLRARLSAQGRAVVGTSRQIQEVFDLVQRVAPSEVTVLLQGESGTGKEVMARAIHERSERQKGPFVPVNCAAIPAELLESELFGHVKGAFTGAIKDRKGKFDQADGGTLFLDEVGELPLELQPKLLRALQEREIEPVGGQLHKVDVRVVAATNRDLEAALQEGTFREDLYYRLAVVTLPLPPLRERRDDIPIFFKHFIEKHAATGKVEISAKAMERLLAYDWPGNVRELENAVERMLVLRRSDRLDLADLPPRLAPLAARSPIGVLNLPEEGYSLEALEREAIVEALRRNGGNQTQAAAFLRIPRHILIYRMEKFAIDKGQFS